MHSEIKYFRSAHNPRLKVKWRQGKKVLNTKNTNYSYGSLVKVLKLGLNRIPLQKVKKVLILGFGAGSIVAPLRQQYEITGKIVGVEVDPVVLDICSTEFGVVSTDNLEIIQDDAWEFVQRPQPVFDLIIVDLFVDVDVPAKFYRQEFWQRLKKMVADQGFILFNAGIDLTESHIDQFVATLPDEFVYQIAFNVLASNTLITLQKVF